MTATIAPERGSPAQPARVASCRDRFGEAHPRVGALVRVARGPAAGARGRVCCCAGGRATLLAVMLTRRPFMLTVDADDCAALANAE